MYCSSDLASRSGLPRGVALLVLLLAVGAASPCRAQVMGGDRSGDRFGSAVAWAGDIDHDGYDDFLIGAPGAVGLHGAAGQVFVFFGRYGVFPATPDLILSGEVSGDHFGFAVSTAGDVNGDGYADFLVGAPENDAAGLNAGKVYLYLGGRTVSTTPARTWTGSLAGARLGAAVAGGFDFNGDGRSDFAIGAPELTDYENGAGLHAGQVQIFLGGAPLTTLAATYSLEGSAANWYLGYSLDPAGDVDGDGKQDLVAGAPQLADVNPGKAVVFFGRADGPGLVPGTVLTGPVGGDRFGWSVSGAGDTDGDGYADLLVGAPAHDQNGLDTGALYLYRGGPTLGGAPAWFAFGSVAGDSLGYAVDGGFDMNGDGVPDFAAGAPGADAPAAGSGQVRIYYGGALPNASADRVLGPVPPEPGFEAGDRFGASVRFVGSYNGGSLDANAGLAELLAGAPDGNALSGIRAGYVDFITGPGTYVPVRVAAFTATPGAAGTGISWILSGASDLAGIRVEAERDGARTPLAGGWLPPESGSATDPDPSAARYHLLGRDRAGGIAELAQVGFGGGVGALALGVPDRNPFRTEVRLPASFPAGTAEVSVWDVRGRMVRALYRSDAGPRSTSLVWDGRDDRGLPVPAGLYFVRARAGAAQTSVKVLRLP